MPEGQAFSARDTWAAESTKTGVASAANVHIWPPTAGTTHGRHARLQRLRHLRRRHDQGRRQDLSCPVAAGVRRRVHVVVLDRRTLAPISDTLYSTNNDLVGQYRMGSELNRMADIYGEGAIVLLATVGKPWGQSFLPAAPPMSGPCQPEIFRISAPTG